MTTAAGHRSLFRVPLLAGGTVLAATTLIGAAWYLLRGPDMSYVPEMAEAPFVMPDGRAIYVQKFEVTIAEWNRCFEDGVCLEKITPRQDQFAQTTPATGLSYVDVSQYLEWIRENSRVDFRLPTVEEWEAIAKEVLPDEPDPIFTDPDLRWASAYLLEGNAPRALKPQGSFSTNSQGIADLDGSVWEWTQDCYAGEGEHIDPERCPAFFVGGEHVAAMSFLVRDPARGGCAVGTPPAHLGMRLVSDRPIVSR